MEAKIQARPSVMRSSKVSTIGQGLEVGQLHPMQASLHAAARVVRPKVPKGKRTECLTRYSITPSRSKSAPASMR